MKPIKTKEPKLASKPEYATMRENAARIESGRANLAELKKVQKKAKVKDVVKKVLPTAAGIAASAIAGGIRGKWLKENPGVPGSMSAGKGAAMGAGIAGIFHGAAAYSKSREKKKK